MVAPPDEDQVRSCPVCRSSVADDRNSVGSAPDQTDHSRIDVLDGAELLTSRPRIRAAGETLRHCNSLVLPRETKERLAGMELKRSLSMGRSTCVTIDLQVDSNLEKDCDQYWGFLREVRQSISRMCVGGHEESSKILLPY